VATDLRQRAGEIHISKVEFDESTGTYQWQVLVPITDPASGELIGAITFGINVQSLLRGLQAAVAAMFM
jgi:hypothetical protein